MADYGVMTPWGRHPRRSEYGQGILANRAEEDIPDCAPTSWAMNYVTSVWND